MTGREEKIKIRSKIKIKTQIKKKAGLKPGLTVARLMLISRR
jgi:hypothetical protein